MTGPELEAAIKRDLAHRRTKPQGPVLLSPNDYAKLCDWLRERGIYAVPGKQKLTMAAAGGVVRLEQDERVPDKGEAGRAAIVRELQRESK